MSDVVQLLELVLARAKEGQILSVAIATQEADRTTSSSWAVDEHGTAGGLAYAVLVLRWRILDAEQNLPPSGHTTDQEDVG